MLQIHTTPNIFFCNEKAVQLMPGVSFCSNKGHIPASSLDLIPFVRLIKFKQKQKLGDCIFGFWELWTTSCNGKSGHFQFLMMTWKKKWCFRIHTMIHIQSTNFKSKLLMKFVVLKDLSIHEIFSSSATLCIMSIHLVWWFLKLLQPVHVYLFAVSYHKGGIKKDACWTVLFPSLCKAYSEK